MAQRTKATDAEIKRRIALVHKMIVAGASRAMILQHSAEKWELSDRQTDEYIGRVKQIISEQMDREKDSNLGLALERMNDIYQKCLAASNYKNAIAAQREINRLLGLYAPEKIEHSGEVALKGYTTASPDDWDKDA